ncbi:antibiotic biosynthesis monooxygenase (ABM) superfamily enzyme [Aureibacter tunicatorum]|uniref:Antibiotic biosynthesis monooxygenase (ABM) superfamily enzyme n=2 Tax=Aureibacter tunicatorum TaxID=866807 RepID=A0AAE4BTC7_9BACT|nr:antibiotic biosynthesis monooxygenase (ABM) superfamily enzyme [Aureibacter tunicatorum]
MNDKLMRKVSDDHLRHENQAGSEDYKGFDTRQIKIWKQVLVTIITVYPLILLTDIALSFLLPMEKLWPEVALLCTVSIVATVLVIFVMPCVNSVFGRWMMK